MAYFFDKSKVALEFFQHRGSKLKFINLERNYYFFFFDFQPVTVDMEQYRNDHRKDAAYSIKTPTL